MGFDRRRKRLGRRGARPPRAHRLHSRLGRAGRAGARAQRLLRALDAAAGARGVWRRPRHWGRAGIGRRRPRGSVPGAIHSELQKPERQRGECLAAPALLSRHAADPHRSCRRLPHGAPRVAAQQPAGAVPRAAVDLGRWSLQGVAARAVQRAGPDELEDRQPQARAVAAGDPRDRRRALGRLGRVAAAAAPQGAAPRRARPGRACRLEPRR